MVTTPQVNGQTFIASSAVRKAARSEIQRFVRDVLEPGIGRSRGRPRARVRTALH